MQILLSNECACQELFPGLLLIEYLSLPEKKGNKCRGICLYKLILLMTLQAMWHNKVYLVVNIAYHGYSSLFS